MKIIFVETHYPENVALVKIEIWIDYGRVSFRTGACLMTPNEWGLFRTAIMEGQKIFQDGELQVEARIRNTGHHAFLEGV